MNQQVDNKETPTERLQLLHDSAHNIDGRNIDCVINIIKELPSLGEKKELTKQQVESLHGLGYQLYEAQCYQEAGDLFRLLCFFESRVARYWIALGGAYQHTKHHDNALAAFTMACLLDSHNPEPRFYAAHTLIDLQDLSLALQAITIAVELCHNNPHYTDLYRHSVALRNALIMQLNNYGS